MKKYFKCFIIVLILVLVSFANTISQQIFTLKKAVTANGGLYSKPASANNGFYIKSTIGQLAIEKKKNANSNDLTMYNGYWSNYYAVNVEVKDDPLSEYKRIKNYPNPFAGKTNIVYELPGTARVSLIIYNISGTEIARLVNGIQDQGSHSVEFSAVSNSGFEFGSGSYLYELNVEPSSMVGNVVFEAYSIRNVMVLVK
ncbi:MAG: T9SS type A sorting domain-containing protein [Candidatus Kapabacteria bacterium]|nr:T9SS type A sorting domain-containing protein [Candidatus Kapabacteria bacterium]